MERFALLGPLKHRPYRLLFSGQVISNLGDWLDYLAIVVILVYQWHLGAPALAAFTTVTFLPMIVVGPFAGVWVDRWSRRTTMITCDLIRAVLVLGFLWAPNIYVVLIIVALKATTSTFFTPAEQALIRLTVPEDDLLSANSLSQLALQATKVFGPALGGLVVLIGGSHAAFVCDSISFFASAAILSRLPAFIATLPVASEEQEQSNFWQEFRAGFAYVLKQRILVVSITSVAAALFIVFTFDSLGPLAIQAVGLNSSVLGLAIGSVGLGTAIGAIAIGQWGQRISSLKVMALGNLVAGIMVALVGSAVLFHLRPVSAVAIVVAVVIWFAMGVAAAAMVVPYGFILQTETLPDFMGRVVATATGFQTAVQFLAPLIGAVIAVTFGVGTVFAIAGILLALLGAFLLFVRVKTTTAISDTDSTIADMQGVEGLEAEVVGLHYQDNTSSVDTQGEGSTL